jgi:hypothetical protein
MLIGDSLYQGSEGGVGIAGDPVRQVKNFDKVRYMNTSFRPIGNLAERVFRSELLDFRTNDFCQPHCDLLRERSLIGREIQPYERNEKLPIVRFGTFPPDDSNSRQQQDNNAEISVKLWSH